MEILRTFEGILGVCVVLSSLIVVGAGTLMSDLIIVMIGVIGIGVGAYTIKCGYDVMRLNING